MIGIGPVTMFSILHFQFWFAGQEEENIKRKLLKKDNNACSFLWNNFRNVCKIVWEHGFEITVKFMIRDFCQSFWYATENEN